MPGFGQSEGDPIDGLINVKLLSEVIRSLAKQHAYAMVAYSQVSAARARAAEARP